MSGDRGLGAVLLVMGAAFYWPATSLPKLRTASGPIGADGFPTAVAVGLFLLGLLFLVRSFRRRPPAPVSRWAPAEEPAGAEEGGGTPELRRDLAALGLTGLFTWALAPFGLVLSTPLYLLALICLLSGRGRWRRGLLIGVATTAALYLVFVAGLGVAIPMWPNVGTSGGVGS